MTASTHAVATLLWPGSFAPKVTCTCGNCRCRQGVILIRQLPTDGRIVSHPGEQAVYVCEELITITALVFEEFFLPWCK